jgi:hypothetical protein
MTYLKQAIKLIREGDNCSGHGHFFSDFIDDWAFHQTGLYVPINPFNSTQLKVAHKLSHVVRNAWRTYPGEDFLGNVIEECGGSGHLSFFRTPPAVSSLMAQVMGVKKGLTNFSDICMGSGSLTLAYIYQTFLKGGSKAVARLNISGEDLSATKVKVSMIQIINLLDILGDDQPLYVHSLKLTTVNSLSRESFGITYHLSGINNKNCQLDQEQKELLNKALVSNVPIHIISQRLRIPINIVKQGLKNLHCTPSNFT